MDERSPDAADHPMDSRAPSAPDGAVVDDSPTAMTLPRGLILLAFFWLVGSWLGSIGLRPPLRPSPESYEPGIKLMMLFLAIGLMLGWPLLRLSQRRSPWPLRQTVLDLIVLIAMTQVIVWPLRLVTTWTRERTAAVDATLMGWTILVGAIVASVIGTSRHGPRILGMSACLAICFLGPASAWIGSASGVSEAVDLIRASPLLEIQTLADERHGAIGAEHWRWIGVLGAAAVGAWASLALSRRFTRPRSGVQAPG